MVVKIHICYVKIHIWYVKIHIWYVKIRNNILRLCHLVFGNLAASAAAIGISDR